MTDGTPLCRVICPHCQRVFRDEGAEWEIEILGDKINHLREKINDLRDQLEAADAAAWRRDPLGGGLGGE